MNPLAKKVPDPWSKEKNKLASKLCCPKLIKTSKEAIFDITDISNKH